MSRTKEREQLFVEMFQFLINKDHDIDPNSSDYIKSRFNGIKENYEDLLANITSKISTWKYEELGSVEKTLLFISFYEIIYDKLNHRIAINEALEIAKNYGHENAFKFLNGILANLVKEMTNE